MGGAQLDSNWIDDHISLTETNSEEKGMQFTSTKQNFVRKNDILSKSSDPYQWEDDSSNSQDGSVTQALMDDSSNSLNPSHFTSSEPSPQNGTRKERLVIKFKRISQKYYIVEETQDSSYLNYSSIRTRFDAYDLPNDFQTPTPTKNNNPKVHRCKTCRKVFNKISTLQTHRKTHTTIGFDKSRSRGFSAADFAKRFSSDKLVKDPNLLMPSEYEQILSKVDPHPSSYPGYVNLRDRHMPYVKPGMNFTVGTDVFQVTDFVGEGGFAKVFSANWDTGPQAEQDSVLKVQMPANDWEWYCLNQIHSRFESLSHPLKEEDTLWEGGFMWTPRCYTYADGNILVTQHQRMGTLLDLVNLTKNADKQIIEPIAIYLTAELLGLLELLHSMKIVHADIKPDNFLVRHTPSTRVESSLQLIDFGKAIDLVVEADPSSDITTVSGGRQGKYHLDYFGIAGSAYCLLFGKYIEVSTAKNRWVVKGTFKRWWQVKMWNQFFDDMLNPKGEEKECLPSLLKWRQRLLNTITESDDLRIGLTRARETIEMKYLEKWRRIAL